MSMYIIDDHPLVRQAIAMLLRRIRPASKVVELEKFSELQAAIIKNGEPELFVLAWRERHLCRQRYQDLVRKCALGRDFSDARGRS
jgi:DNA-binding NarL/FixJ family response regulator